MDGRTTPSDDVLLERTLAFSGSYTSDDGHVTIRRFRPAPDYSTARFAGHCVPCARSGLTPPVGEPLADLTVAARFAAAHRHGEVD
jgi:hypothetical protein